MDVWYTIEILLFFVTIITAIGYVTVISSILSGWEATPEWKAPRNYDPKTKISIVIAARNEQDKITDCIHSILENKYPKDLFEVIIIDDNSEDTTADLVGKIKSPNVKLIKFDKKNGKKQALASGIASANGSLIITTDADTNVGPLWIISIVSYYEKSNAKLIAAPIQYDIGRSILQRFQHMDAINNMAVTANGIISKRYYMANGANLIFTKSVYDEVGGYTNSKSASGDDMMMIQAVAKSYPSDIRYLKSQDAIVMTKPEKTARALMNQRKRWASKTQTYTDKGIIKLQAFVFMFVTLLLLNLCISFMGSGLSFFGFLFGLFIKLAIDYMYLARLEEFFPSKDALKSFIPASLLFLAYIILAGWWAIFPSEYAWKGRKVR